MLKKLEKYISNHIDKIRVKNFRSHKNLELHPGNSSVLIYGSHGVGKTSILEAISIFSNGRGIRNAKFLDMTNKDKVGFSVDLGLYVKDKFILEYQTSYNKFSKVRKILINNKETSNSYIRKNIPMLWIAPYTEKIFTGSSALRRAFLDRLVAIFDNQHSVRLSEYEKCLRQRAKLLKERSNDINWIEVLEKQLSRLSVSISSSRIEILSRLEKYLIYSVKLFPKIEIYFAESLETKLASNAAIDLEENMLEEYFSSREVDRLLGGSRVGCHKTDLIIKNIDKNLNAELCSSGEQKAILISLVLSAATAFKEYSKKSPIILLDEVFTHLDLQKKSSLLEKLIELDSQTWITATESEKFFQDKRNFFYHHLTKNGLQNV